MHTAGLAAAIAATIAVTGVADASTYRFTYLADAGTITGKLTGTLQGDRNTVNVTGVTDSVTIDGVAAPSLPFVTTGSSIYGIPRAPTVTFDGSRLDFFACTVTEYCSDQGIGFDPDVVAFKPVLRILIGAVGPDLIEEDAFAARWSLTAVPEPTSWAMLIAGFGAVGILARRRSRVVAA